MATLAAGAADAAGEGLADIDAAGTLAAGAADAGGAALATAGVGDAVLPHAAATSAKVMAATSSDGHLLFLFGIVPGPFSYVRRHKAAAR